MPRENYRDILAFVAVATELSFTKAASRLGVSQSALSHTIRSLESRLGVQLMTRTTRSVSLTEAGERLLMTAGPRLDEIEAELKSLAEERDHPSGRIRITATDYSANTLVWPRLSPVLQAHPKIRVEVITDHLLVDPRADHSDIDVHWGDVVAKDMIAVRIGPDRRMMIVGSPQYLALHPPPLAPIHLTAHNCINLRLPTKGDLLPWELRKDGKLLEVRAEGQLICGSIYHTLEAALAGHGLAYIPDDLAQSHVASGSLRPVLQDWSTVLPGHHACYPSKRSSRAMSIIIDALRYRP